MNNRSTIKNRRSSFNNRLVIFLVSTVITMIAFSSCNKSDDELANNVQYYVKYEVNSSTIYYGGKLKVDITNENNQLTTFNINTKTPWEIVIGPVKKGFDANLSVFEMGDNYGKLTLQTKISVSKNESPFALKASDEDMTPRKSAIIGYTINY